MRSFGGGGGVPFKGSTGITVRAEEGWGEPQGQSPFPPEPHYYLKRDTALNGVEKKKK